MAENPIKLLDVVALTVDLPDYNLWRGQVGTVVETLANNRAFEVEFSDRDGRTFESIGLRHEQIMILHSDRSRWNEVTVVEEQIYESSTTSL
jgi:hypothetical protein